MQTSQRHLVLGGARSGKTGYALQLAETLANQRSAPVLYVATAQAHDVEMAERIARHRAERPVTWRTLEAPTSLAQSLAAIAQDTIVIVDCLTLWLSNALLIDFNEQHARDPLPSWNAERDDMLRHVRTTAGALILVSNEVGSGIVPLSAMARRFQDEQGWLNQSLAAACDAVTLVVAGIGIAVKTAD